MKVDRTILRTDPDSEIWDDQPPLHTFLVAEFVKHLGRSILWPRLLTVGFACLLLSSVFLFVERARGKIAAVIATCILVASPGFLELSASCMQEVPALAVADFFDIVLLLQLAS